MNLTNSTQLFIVLTFITALIACESAPTMLKTDGGFEYQLTKDAPGELPQIGDYVLFHLKQFVDDSLLNDSRDNAFPLEFKWVPDEERQKMKHPVVDILSHMSKEDEGYVLQPIDSMMRLRMAGMADAEHIRYEVVVQDVLNTEGYTDYTNKRTAGFKAKEAQIKTKVDAVLADYKANKLDLKDDVMGMKYTVLEKGTGEKKQAGEVVQVNYYGVLESDGSMFDNSFQRGQAFSFPLGRGQVIRGWDEGIAALNVGDKAVLFIPYEMAYGEAGRPPSIPERSNLVFYVEVLD